MKLCAKRSDCDIFTKKSGKEKSDQKKIWIMSLIKLFIHWFPVYCLSESFFFFNSGKIQSNTLIFLNKGQWSFWLINKYISPKPVQNLSIMKLKLLLLKVNWTSVPLKHYSELHTSVEDKQKWYKGLYPWGVF